MRKNSTDPKLLCSDGERREFDMLCTILHDQIRWSTISRKGKDHPCFLCSWGYILKMVALYSWKMQMCFCEWRIQLTPPAQNFFSESKIEFLSVVNYVYIAIWKRSCTLLFSPVQMRKTTTLLKKFFFRILGLVYKLGLD